MITSLILGIIYVAILIPTLPLRLLPDVQLPQNLLDAISNGWASLFFVDMVLPVALTAGALTLVLGYEATVFVYRGINWTIRKIPGIS